MDKKIITTAIVAFLIGDATAIMRANHKAFKLWKIKNRQIEILKLQNEALQWLAVNAHKLTEEEIEAICKERIEFMEIIKEI